MNIEKFIRRTLSLFISIATFYFVFVYWLGQPNEPSFTAFGEMIKTLIFTSISLWVARRVWI